MINPLAISHRADPASCRFAGKSNARRFFSLLAPAVRGFFLFNGRNRDTSESGSPCVRRTATASHGEQSASVVHARVGAGVGRLFNDDCGVDSDTLETAPSVRARLWKMGAIAVTVFRPVRKNGNKSRVPAMGRTGQPGKLRRTEYGPSPCNSGQSSPIPDRSSNENGRSCFEINDNRGESRHSGLRREPLCVSGSIPREQLGKYGRLSPIFFLSSGLIREHQTQTVNKA